MIRVLVVDDKAEQLQTLRGVLSAYGYEMELAQQDGEALRASEERYRKLFDYAPDGIVIADRQSYYLDANGSMCRMLGYTREEFIGLHATDIVVPAEIENIEPALQTIAAYGDYNRQWQFRRKDGSTFFAEVMVTSMPDGSLLGMIRDITERKQADDRIRELNRTYSVLSDINQLIVREREPQAIVDRACRIAVEKGDFLLAWIGIKDARDGRLKLAAHAGATDDTLHILHAILAEPRPGCIFTARALDTGVQAVCNDIESDSLAAAWRNPALQRGYRAMASFPLIVNRQHLGTFNLYADRVGFFDADELRLLDELAGDISFSLASAERDRERRELEQQLAQAQKMQAIGTLAGGIAHDFNNIVGAIAGNAELARLDLPDTHPAAACIEEIKRAAQRAKELVQRILTFSRPQDQSLQPILLRPVLEEAARLLRSSIPAGVEIKLEGARELPAVRANESQIHQVVLNLVTNAWHALPNNSGCIDIRLDACRVDNTLCQAHRELKPGPHVRLSVRDNGVGMSAATIDRLFEPFFTTKPPSQGTGLGLSVVHGIVRDHGGAIVVESRPGQGSAFHVYLPACAESAVPPRAEPTTLAVQGRGERILYLDDDESLVYLAMRFLERLGYRVDGFTLADEALKAFRAEPQAFDLVITDHNMPGMSGIDVAQQIFDARPDAAVALASGYMRPTEVERARALGIRHIFLKPDTVAEFGPTVQRILAERTLPSH